MSVLDRELRSLTQAGVTTGDIQADSSNIFISLDNVNTGQSERETLKADIDEATTILGGGGGVSTIATSFSFLLNNAGDNTGLIDLTTLTPPVSSNGLFVQVFEEGIAGGELFGQELFYNQSFTGARFSDTIITENNIAYSCPNLFNSVLKINIEEKNSQLIGSVSASKGWTQAAYDPITKKMFATPSAGGAGILVVETDTDTVRELTPSAAQFSGMIRANDGFIYYLTRNTGVNTQLFQLDPNTEISTPFGSALTGSGTGLDYLALQQIGNELYTTNYLDPVGTVARIDITSGTPTWTKVSVPTQSCGTGIVLGNKIYFEPAFAPNNSALVYDTATHTAVTVNLGQTGFQGALSFNNLIYFLPRAAVGFVEFNPQTNTFRTLGITSGVGSGVEFEGSLVIAPLGSTRVVEFDINPPFTASPTNPEPYFAVNNLFDTSGSIDRAASTEDYSIDITRTLGVPTGLTVTMLTEGSKNVRVNIQSGGF